MTVYSLDAIDRSADTGRSVMDADKDSFFFERLRSSYTLSTYAAGRGGHIQQDLAARRSSPGLLKQNYLEPRMDRAQIDAEGRERGRGS